MYKESNLDIRDRMLNKVPNDLDKSEGSFFYDVFSPVSEEFAQRKSDLDEIIELSFPQTAYGKYLDFRAEEHGVYRKEGNKSLCKGVVFKGIDNAQVPKDTIVQTQTGLQYSTINSGIVKNGKVEIQVQALECGEKYNVDENTINEIPMQVQGIISVNNPNPSLGGSDEESDEKLKERMLKKVQNPPSSGNKLDYERWAREVNGVEDAKIISLWKGPGTVKVICYGQGGSPVDNEIIDKVKNYIDPKDGTGDGKAPIGAKVTIATVKNTLVNVIIQGLKSNTMETAKKNIKNNLLQFINEIRPGDTLKLINIYSVVANTNGVYDFKGIKFKDVQGNFEATNEEKLMLGDIIYE